MIRIVLILCILTTSVFAQETLSLRQAIETALVNNYSIRLVKKSAEIAQNNDSPGNAGMLPRLDINAGYSYSLSNGETVLALNNTETTVTTENSGSRSFNTGAQLSWTIFDGFAMFASSDKLGALRERSDIEIQVAIENTVRELANSFYSALKAQENLDLMKENLAISRERLRRARDRGEFGVATGLELLSAQVDYNTDSTNYLRAELAYVNSIRSLNYIMGINTDEEYILSTDKEFDSLPEIEQLRDDAFANNTSINRALNDREISQLDKDMIISAYYPRIALSAGYSIANTVNDQGFILETSDDKFTAGMNLSMNIFDGFRTNIANENAQVMIEMSQVSIEQVRTLIDLNISNSYDTYERRRVILEIEQSNLAAAETNFERTNELFKLGQVNSVELREAQLNLLRSRNAISNAFYDTKISETELKLLSGNILAE